ncbi:MAG: tetratricopeptide repeat protein [Ferruginibacter sp.]
MERIEKLKEFLRQNAHDDFIQHALALEYIKAGDDNEAEKLFLEILKRNPAYIGSYYHLAKLYERNGKEEDAIKIYKSGMEVSKEQDKHTYNELRAAYEELTL